MTGRRTTGTPGELAAVWRDVQRAVARRRWLLAAGLAAAAVATALPALAPPPPTGTTVLAAARDLAAGTPLAAGDVVGVLLPDELLPDGALGPGEQVAGRLVAGPVRRGEPLTDVRLVGPGLLALAGDPDLVAVPVRLADPASAALVRPGDRVDVLGADSASGAVRSGAVQSGAVQSGAVQSGAVQGDAVQGDAGRADIVRAGTGPSAAVLAAGAQVLAVPAADADLEGALVVLAVLPSTAARLAGAAVTSRLSVVLVR